MSLATVQAADFVKIHEDLGSPTFTWGGASYRCIPSGFSRKKIIQIGGQLIEAAGTLKALKSDFNSGSGPFPNDTNKDKLTFRSRSYKAEVDVTNESNVFLVIVCVHDGKGG